jgi:hypothetical protein
LQQITDIIIFEMWHLSALDITSQKEEICCIRASPPMLSMWPCKNVSHIQVLVTNFFPTPPIKLKLWLEVSGRLVIATHLDQSNYLPNEKQGALNKYDLVVFIRLLQVSSRALKTLQLLQGPSTRFCSWTSSKISSGVGGSHTEHWWRCSYYVKFIDKTKTHSWIYVSNPSSQLLCCNLLP